MLDHALAALEFDSLCALLARRARTPLGKEAAAGLSPASDERSVADLLAETAEARRALLAGTRPALSGTFDIRPHLRRARRKGGELAGEELLEVASTLQTCAEARAELLALPPEEFPRLRALAGRMWELPGVVSEIRRCIGPTGEVLDEASEALAELRARIRSVRERIRGRLEKLVSLYEREHLFEGGFVTHRSGRYVLPVFVQHRHRVPGIVHDRSSRGATLFIEPEEVVPLGNELVELSGAQAEEERRIRISLTELVGGVARQIAESLEALARVDLAFARAALAVDYGMTEPAISDDGSIELRGIRHPLLVALVRGELEPGGGTDLVATPPKEVVPIDVVLPRGKRTLVISGPNAGGKTVALKTIGLAALMVRSGLFLAARSGSRIPLFPKVFAEIGDEQSIAQSLSTFSSRVTRLASILEAADADSLVLLDEVGAGTDPTEGAALAMAVFDELAARGAMVVATTHLGALKTYAYIREWAENGSVEFDVDRLEPTYRLVIGVPGNSNALAIAARLGLPQGIIEAARALSAPSAESDVLRRVEEAVFRLESQRETAARAEREARGLREALEAERARMDEEARRFAKRVEEEAYGALEQVRDGLMALRAKLGTPGFPAIAEVGRLVALLEKALRRSPRYQSRAEFLKRLQPGTRIGIAGSLFRGRVVSVDRERRQVRALVRGKEVVVPFDEVEPPSS